MKRWIDNLFAAREARDTFRRADAERNRGNWGKASELYAQGLGLMPGRFSGWVQCGHARKESGDFTGAMQAYQTALNLRPHDADLHLHLGHLFAITDREAMASHSYGLAASYGSTDPHAMKHAGILNRGQSTEATVAAECFLRADAMRDLGNLAAAAAFYQDGLRLEPTSFPHWVQLGHMRKEIGDFEDAERAYNHAASLHPRDADLMIQIGHLYKTLGEYSKAGSCYADAISLGSHDRHALRFLAESEARFPLYREMLNRLAPPSDRTPKHRRSEAGSFAMQVVQLISQSGIRA